VKKYTIYFTVAGLLFLGAPPHPPPPPRWARAASFTRFLDHTRRTTVGRTPLYEWSAHPRDLYYLTTHNTIHIDATGGIRSHTLSTLAAADLFLRPSGTVKRKFCPMVCTGTLRGKHSHLCLGQAQSIQCAVMQLTTAVGCRTWNVRPAPTNACLMKLPVEPDVGYPAGFVTKKSGSPANGTNHSRRMSLIV
jgi:hypothetical protein